MDRLNIKIKQYLVVLLYLYHLNLPLYLRSLINDCKGRGKRVPITAFGDPQFFSHACTLIRHPGIVSTFPAFYNLINL